MKTNQINNLVYHFTLRRRSFQTVLSALIVLVSCASHSQQPALTAHAFRFSLGNSDRSKFGWRQDDATGEITSIASLCRYQNTVYLVDPVHGNIKSVDLLTGELSASQKLTDSTTTLNDIAFYKGKIYVSTRDNFVYMLSPLLSLIKVERISSNLGRKVFLNRGNNLYIFADPADVGQDDDFMVKVAAKRIVDGLAVAEETLQMGKGYNYYQRAKNGYSLTNEKRCIVTADFETCLDRAFPSPQYLCRNIFVNQTSVSFFEFEGNNVQIVSIDVK